MFIVVVHKEIVWKRKEKGTQLNEREKNINVHVVATIVDIIDGLYMLFVALLFTSVILAQSFVRKVLLLIEFN